MATTVHTEITPDDELLLRALNDPVFFGESFLRSPMAPTEPLVLRWYQKKVLKGGDMKAVRMGRRVGKSVTAGVQAIWGAFCHPNYQVIIVAPSENAITELMERSIVPMIYDSDAIRPSISKHTRNPHIIEFTNGSTIKAFTSGTDGKMLRGQSCDMLIIDEADYIPAKAMTAIIPLMSSRTHVPTWVSSTPSGLRTTFFYQVCTQKDLGFEEYHYSSKVSPLYTDEQDKLYRGTYTEEEYQHEILAEFGEAAAGVYPEKHILPALAQYEINSVEHPNVIPQTNENHYFMGVDWNGDATGVQICILEQPKVPVNTMLNQVASSQNGKDTYEYRPVQLEGDFLRVFYTETITRQSYTQSQAVQRIIELTRKYRLDAINVDMGYGAYQYETLKSLGKKDKTLRYDKILMGTNFGSTIELIDPFTQQKIKKPVKPIMVGLSQRLLEQRRLFLPECLQGSRLLVSQMRGYHIHHFTERGAPVYEKDAKHGDHMLDAMILAIYAYNKGVHPLMQQSHAESIRVLPHFRPSAVQIHTGSRQIGGDGSLPVGSLGTPVSPKTNAQYFTLDPRAARDEHADGWNAEEQHGGFTNTTRSAKPTVYRPKSIVNATKRSRHTHRPRKRF